MRIAAIDCGSNSFHLLIADVGPHDQLVVVEDDKSILHLGAEVASSGNISPSSLLRARRVIRHYKNLIERHMVEEVMCVATSAIRSASNGDEVIAALTKTLGHHVRVISGEEEARTIFRAISAISTLPESRVLACDMGGGSLELMAGQRHGLEHAISVPLGASRVARELHVSDPLSEDDIANITEKYKKSLKAFTQEYPPDLFSHIVASSGTLTTIVSMARALTDGYVSPPLSVITATSHEISTVCTTIISAVPDQRRKLLGYDNARDEFLSTAAVIARGLMSTVASHASWMISPYALREGLAFLAADKEGAHDASSLTEIAGNTIADLEHRMSVFTPVKPVKEVTKSLNLVDHGRHVAELSQSLFDQLKSLHKLPKHNRELLGFGARLHDIGETISHSKHDQHGGYILSSIPLVGFSPEDATVLRGIVRWHRIKNPKKSDRFVGRLSDDDFHRTQWLCAILRIADGADSGKAQNVSSISASIKPDVVFLRFSSTDDCELELYSARRKRALLESMIDRDVVIEQARQDSD